MPFHCDICFASNNLGINDIKIKSIEEWNKHDRLSDHLPIIIEYEFIAI